MLGWHFKEGSLRITGLSCTMRDDLTGACNDVKASIVDKESLFTSVLVSDGTESESNVKRKTKSKFSLINHSPSTLAVLLKSSLLMLVT